MSMLQGGHATKIPAPESLMMEFGFELVFTLWYTEVGTYGARSE
jgi:hypothetical protein